MNGNLSFKIIDDYIKGKINIDVLEQYLVHKVKLENFNKNLFYKFVDVYKNARTQTNAWDENGITYSLVKEIMTSLKKQTNLSYNIFKANGKYETNFGDIAFIIRFNYKTGKSFEGYGFIEAKRDYPKNNFEFSELKQDQLDNILKNTHSSFYCFYSHHSFFPTVKTEYLKEHLKILKENKIISSIKKLNYSILSDVIKPITFQEQYNRFINGYDLDYGENPKNIAYGFDIEYLPKVIIEINQFEDGITPTPIPTPNENKYSKVTLDDLIKKNNDIDDDIGYEPPSSGMF